MENLEDFLVGDRIVRPALGEVCLGDETVHLEPRSMGVLVALSERPSAVVPKQELIEAVWGEAFVSDEVLTHAIWDLRRAFADQASNPRFIQTIPKRGYRLIAEVKALAPQGPVMDERRSWSLPTLAWAAVVLLLLASVAALVVESGA